jgi:hypothetical protein
MRACLFCKRQFNLADLNMDHEVSMAWCSSRACEVSAGSVMALVRGLQVDADGNMALACGDAALSTLDRGLTR